ncbi:MAG: MBL fold metallo-hydrolase RNA specificity domain-containing protein [Candidatus Bilamarchaeaceae archaeon]
MRFTAYGGAREVGRSAFVLEERGKHVLLDCGVMLGEKVHFPLFPEGMERDIKDVIISHAHLDHSGYLGQLIHKGSSPTIHGLKPTKDLIGVLLADYHRIGKNVEFSEDDVAQVSKRFRAYNFRQEFKAGGYRASLYNAGHILGSAMVLLHGTKKVLYSGDISMRGTRLLDGCERGLSADALILEGTYGNEELPGTKASVDRLIHEIRETIKEGGHVIIPSFAVGRGQEILLLLESYMRSGALPHVKIYMDGMVKKAMKIYRQNIPYAKEEVQKRVLMSADDPFASKHFFLPRSKGRKEVLEEPCIIVSTSGMLSGGPVLLYLKELGGNPKNKIIFVGYQAEGTRGRAILEGEREIVIDGEEVRLRLKVAEVRLSGHAGKSELLQFARGIKGLKKVILVHGELEGLEAMARNLEKDFDVEIPSVLEEIKV